jgi:tRNA(fMet)-specific endonuclease VapC
MNEYLLDTNAIIPILNGDANIASLLVGSVAFVPIIAVAELYFGAEKSRQTEANIKRVDEFISQRTILTCDKETARWFGRIEYRSRAKGKAIPQNDIWIAAIAIQHQLTVLTRDAHFREIDGLLAANW